MADKTWQDCKDELSRLGCTEDNSIGVITVLSYKVNQLMQLAILLGDDEQAEIAIMKHLIDFIRSLQDDKEIQLESIKEA